jgi:hypothetical protein
MERDRQTEEDRWFVYHSMVEDEPRRTAVDVGLRAPDLGMPHLSWLAVPLASQRGYGFTPEEGSVLDALTERFLSPPPPSLLGRIFAGKPNPIVFAGRVTGGSVCKLYFYSSHEIPDRHFAALEQAAPGYSFDASSALDPAWRYYFHELHPGSALAPLMTSHAQVEMRKAEGDQLEVPREVDHTLAFRDAASRGAFVAALGGYWRVRLYELDGPAERRFFVGLTQSHSVTQLTTDRFIVSLASRADLQGGVYDGWGAVTVLPE